ncbi:hypothetical protein PAPYR_7739 [Paratrimastix pyriformis]|uniref:Uncharacterized protein n=1 Tax=Paratrimastix pyriformis TaxID=342808 RepID=A0ABQ8UEQ5_9EUKA|nr:hypothetical protein PAPYR_7739 [Paratrimastix pyriformis]
MSFDPASGWDRSSVDLAPGGWRMMEVLQAIYGADFTAEDDGFAIRLKSNGVAVFFSWPGCSFSIRGLARHQHGSISGAAAEFVKTLNPIEDDPGWRHELVQFIDAQVLLASYLRLLARWSSDLGISGVIFLPACLHHPPVEPPPDPATLLGPLGDCLTTPDRLPALPLQRGVALLAEGPAAGLDEFLRLLRSSRCDVDAQGAPCLERMARRRPQAPQ